MGSIDLRTLNVYNVGMEDNTFNGIVIHQDTKILFRSCMEFLSKCEMVRTENRPNLHIKKIIERANSKTIKELIMFPYEGDFVYSPSTITYCPFVLSFKLKLSETPLTLGSEDFTDYYKEIVIWQKQPELNMLQNTSLKTTRSFWKDFISYVYENNYIPVNKYSNRIMLFEYEYSAWEQIDDLDKKSLNTIFLPNDELQSIINRIDVFIENKERYATLGVPHNILFLFHGIPGSGKTSLIHAVASHFNLNIATFDFGRDVNDRVLKKAIQKLPEDTVLVIEDIDCLFGSRKPNDEHKNEITFSGLLNILDGINQVKDMIVFITTNHIEQLDCALKRRIHHFMKFDYATNDQKTRMINTYFPDTKPEVVKKLIKPKTTMNILQKFLIKSLNDVEIQNVDDFENFNNEYINLQNSLYS